MFWKEKSWNTTLESNTQTTLALESQNLSQIMCKSLSEENFHFRTEALYLLGSAQPKYVCQNIFWTSWHYIRIQNPSNNRNFTKQFHRVLIKLFCSAERGCVLITDCSHTAAAHTHTHCHAPHVPPSIHPGTAIRYLIIMQVTLAGLLPQWTDPCRCLDANTRTPGPPDVGSCLCITNAVFQMEHSRPLVSLAGIQSSYIPS